jgi:uncharacterized membrane protein YoaK (UPF0700 family)
MGVWSALIRDERHGPLPGLLVLLTAVSGIVDAISILRLDRVFVANITGNIIFIALALTGARGFSILAPLLALTGFVGGAAVGGVTVGRTVLHRGRALRTASIVQLADLITCTGIALCAGDHPAASVRYLLIVVLASGMGFKSAIVRRVNVPGLTTSVFTSTLTGLASDGPGGGWRDVHFRIRGLAAAALFIGAAAGAALLLHTALWCPFGLASALLVVITWGAHRASAVTAPWTTSR